MMEDAASGVDNQHRVRTMTEQGMARYVAHRDQHLSDVTSAFKKLLSEADRIEKYSEDLTALQDIRGRITTQEAQLQTHAKACLDFLQRSNTAESLEDKAKLEAALTEQQRQTAGILARLQTLTTSLAETDVTSSISSTSSTATMKRAKADSARKRLEYARKEAEVKKKKAALEVELELLSHEKEAASAEAEAEVYEKQESSHRSLRPTPVRKLPTEDRAVRTAAYVKGLTATSGAGADTNVAPEPPTIAPEATTSPKFNLDAPVFVPAPTQACNTNEPPPTFALAQDWTGLLLRKELLLTRISSFTDRPEAYACWKETFQATTRELLLSPAEELDLLVKWLGPDSKRQAASLRQANPRSPQRALQYIWERLDERYGAPEMVEHSLRQKLTDFPKLTNKDSLKLYELSDLLSEIEATKEDPQYSRLLAYFDTSSGVNPIVSKLPTSLQDKWTTHAIRYNENHGAYFPPFNEFLNFVRTQSKVRNNPCFVYDTQPPAPRKLTPVRESVFTRKTNVFKDPTVKQKEFADNSEESRCPIHNTRHSLADCRGFRLKSIAERREILRKCNGCFRCCRRGHARKDCKEAVHCQSCDKEDHPTAMHVESEERQTKRPTIETTAQADEHATSKCTQICGSSMRNSKSCAKMLLVDICPEDQTTKTVRAYAIVDDQSNHSLAKSELFNLLDIQGEEIVYTLNSCNGRTKARGRKAHGLTISSIDGQVWHRLPPIIECDEIPDTREEIPTPEVARHHPHLRDIEAQVPPVDPEAKILLLIGRDLIEAHHVHEQRIGPRRTPYAQRLSLGWTIIGESCLGGAHRPATDSIVVNKTHVTNNRPSLLTPCPNAFKVETPLEFNMGRDVFLKTPDDDKPGLSIEDHEFLEVMDKTFERNQEGSWVAPLPFRRGRPRLPNNKSQAQRRARTLNASLQRDPRKRQHFVSFMEEILDAGHAEVAPELKPNEECWYLPIFGVYHPKKPDQLRGVFDSSACFNGLSLNDVLMTGPDLTNSLLGILVRFRREAIAVVADIKKMFYAFKVPEQHRNFLRFLWYANNDPTQDFIEYRMRVHVFGNSSSPAIATYGLRKTAQTEEARLGTDMRQFVERDFYVDDALTSLPTTQSAVDLIHRTQQALSEGGNLRLHKIASNNKDVMSAFPPEDVAKDLRGLDLTQSSAPLQRTLGISWNIQTDAFTFCVSNPATPDTRRGVLSTINSLYDPLGFAAPVTIQGKLLLRELTGTTSDWDTPLPEDLLTRWQQWKESLQALGDLQVPRAYAQNPSTATRRELHVFADASEKAIAAVAFLKISTPVEEQASIVLGKAKVAPKHALTMPRLELCAAVLAAEVGSFVQENLELPIDATMYYSDSRVVLGYVRNRTRRFYTYVANRVQQILTRTEAEQWRYIPTHMNPADSGTRSVPANQLGTSDWLQGPNFLRSKQHHSDVTTTTDYVLAEKDPEVRPEVTALATKVTNNLLGSARFSRFSRWLPLVRAITRLARLASAFTTAGQGKQQESVDTEDLEHARKLILRDTQHDSFTEEIAALRKGSNIPKDSTLMKLDPYLDSDGLLRVGGRLRLSNLDPQEKHPFIIHRSHHVATLIVRYHHEQVMHQGRHFTEGAVRAAGYWIIGGKRLVSSIIFQCVTCRKLRRKLENQKMANLPASRLNPGAPFTQVGVDTFGPWQVTTRRTRGGQANNKRWAILFTCLTTRAIHIEVVEELSSSSCINAIRRFYAVRGSVKAFYSDCGTNFIGCSKEHQLLNGAKWIFNPPHASHMGGIWERMIGIARRIVDAIMLQTSNKPLTHEVLVTFMAEVCAIVNARPLVPVSTDPENPETLSPSMLLTQKTADTVYLDDVDSKDLYRVQWRRVQALADTFWKRWSAEYLVTLQKRRKWADQQRNVKEGDVILLKDKDIKRNNWPLGVVIRTMPGEDGLVRKVELRIWKDGKPHIFTRPITEVIMLVEN